MGTVQKPGKLCIDALWAGEHLKYVYNRAKDRREIWRKYADGGSEWVLEDAQPGNHWEEYFMGTWTTLGAFWGIILADQNWGCAARSGGAGVSAANFADLNELTGGLDLITGAINGDWTAIDWGSIYPVVATKSPYLHFIHALTAITTLKHITGLVGATNKPANNSTPYPALGTFPYDGVFVLVDTSVTPPAQLLSYTGGVLVDSATLDITLDTDHHDFDLQFNDDGDEVTFIVDGTRKGSVSVTTTAQLQPYIMIMTRTTAARHKHCHHARLISDYGF